MNCKRQMSIGALGLAVTGALAISTSVLADDHDRFAASDFGHQRDALLNAMSRPLFGIARAIDGASRNSIDQATAEADPLALVNLAQGLHASVLSAEADLGANIDMMTLFPASNPTHIIACNEQGTTEAGIQRVRLSDGAVETILTGTRSCDPAHVTPWGTVIVGEERDDGTILEIIDPLSTTNVQYDRAAGTFSGSDAANVTERPAIGHLAFEGVVVYPNGVLYFGDENRPFEGTGGGAYFKFIPNVPWGSGAPITQLAQSPLAGGTVYGLRLGKRSGDTDYGQGSEIGRGAWVRVVNAYDASLRDAAADMSLTGYYRPEDADADRGALAEGNVRFCANNTGNEGSDQNWGNTICVTDGTLAEAAANTATPLAQLFVVGTPDFSMMDNIAYQPGRGNWMIQEDRDAVELSGAPYPFNNSIWSCLEDGHDTDTLSDGCVRWLTLNDLTAETTGGFFDASGEHYYLSVQHNITGHGIILDVTGWR
jgi:secreted PhoX family phosphatase